MNPQDWQGIHSPLAEVVRDVSARNVDAILAQNDLLREQANIEQTVVEGGYNTKQVNELIQNASDAMDGLEGRLEVILTDDHLYCANEGMPFQEPGIRAIMMSHSSSKDSDDIGRFGLGFKSVLVLSDTPEIFSRSASFRWDQKYLRKRLDGHSMLKEADALPTLRVAEPLDPLDEARHDPILASLMVWASTVVRLPLRHAVPWLGPEVVNFPGTFLLFSDKIGSLVLDDRRAGTRVEWKARRDTDQHVVLSRNDVEEAWNVFALEHKPSTIARAEAGRLAAREEMIVKWAVPRSGAVKRGELWTHFPTTSTTTLSGIVNAPFKMNEDRHNLLECRYNEEILTRTLPRIVSGALATIVDAQTPARVLSVLPARGRESQSWADKILNDAVWQAVAAVPCLPDTHGELHAANHILVPDLNASQDDDGRELAELWYGTAARFDIRGWIDLACITNRELNSKVERVLELQKTSRRPVREWIQALVNPLDLDSLEATLGIVQKIQRSYSKFQEAAQQAYMVRDAAGQMRRPITTELSLPADLSEAAAGNPQIIDPELVRHGNCHAILIDLGFKVMNAHGRLHRQLTLVKKDPSNPQLMASAWTISRGADKPGRVAQILAEHLKAQDILVRCQDQEWRPLGQVWLKGQLFPTHHSRDTDLLVDSFYHAQDLQVLRLLGARMELPQDQIRTKSRSEPLYAMWADAVSVELTEQLRKDEVPVMPQNVRLGEVYLTPGVEQLCGTSPEIRNRVTLRLMRHELYPTTPSLSGMYQESLPDIAQPDLWWIQQYGYLDTYYGLIPVSQCVGGVLGYPEDELPRPKDPAAAAFLDLPSRPEDIDWPTTLDLAARALPVKKLHDLYGRVAMQGVTRPDQLIVRSGGSRRPVVADVCIVTTSDRTAQHLEATDDKTYVIQVESEAQAAALVTNWGLRRVDIVFSTTIDCRATEDLTPVAKTLPHAREVAPKVPSTLKVQWCSHLSLVEGNDHDDLRIETPVTEHLDRLHRMLFIRGTSNSLNLWSALRRTYGLAETARELDLTHRRIEQEHLRGGMTEAERWVDALGQEAFEKILPGTVIDMVEGLSENPITAEELFQLAKTVHGVDLLEELKAYFAEQTGSARIPEQSAVWQHFRGMTTAATRRPSTARPPAREEVMGPIRLKDLHGYQKTVVDKIGCVLDGSTEHRRGLLMLPTGAGKTRAMTEALVRHVASPKNSGAHLIVWFAHTKELCEQAIDSWKAVWQAVGAEGERMAVSRFYEGNREQTEPEKVRLHLVVSTPQTMIRIVNNPERSQSYRWLFGADVVVADEAHGSISPTYTEIFKAFGRDHRSRNKVTLGMTATPYRGQDEAGTRRLVARYDGNLIQPDEFDTPTAHTYLQELGVLSRVRHEVLEGMTLLRKAPAKARSNEDEEFDDDETTRMAELYLDLDAVAGNSERNQILLQHLLSRGRDGFSIVFAATVAHAEALAATLEHKGIPAAAISGATSAPLRRAAVEDFRAGRIRVLTNYNVLSEGFDAPGVDAVYVARPTFSPNRYLQMIGRGLRGPKNGGSEWTTIVNVQDNVSAFGTKLAFDHFEHLWTPALV